MNRVLPTISILVCLVACWAFASWYAWSKNDAVLLEEPASFRVDKGERFIEAYRNLARGEFVQPSWRWLVLLSIKRLDCLQAGLHTIPKEQTPSELLDTLCKPGREDVVTITVPEGKTRWGLADLLSQSGNVHRDRFIDITGVPIQLKELGFKASTAEGFLFPDTYQFSPDDKEPQIVARMLDRFQEVWLETLQKHPGKLGSITSTHDLSLLDVVTVASIVEREAARDDERSKIAQVIYNRIEKGMPLQMDPTCIYGPKRYDKTPSPELCKSNANAYSTYAHKGLPPGPISNPGRASLEAALNPSGDENLLFFVATQDGSGSHVFSSTYEEHRQNIQKYLR